MKVKDLLLEVPLPADWDKAVYKPTVSFKQRVEYAKQRAAKMGAGSSRVAFEIPFEGRPTVLKVAKNAKGMAQNEYEAQMLNDYYVTGLGITIPIIDYDEEHDQPTWIHTEKAGKMTPSLFKKYFNGLSPNEVMELVTHMIGRDRHELSPETIEKYQEIYDSNETINSLVDLVGNYDIAGGDFARAANWGIYNNEPVIIDVGASTEIIKQHYS
jgi:hypothetical protein